MRRGRERVDIPSCTGVQLKSIEAGKKKVATFLEATSDPSFTAGGFALVFKARELDLR